MRIADEIEYVMREFVAAEDLFAALAAEQQISFFQVASWMSRNGQALERVPMIECNHELRDFGGLETGWIGDVLFNYKLGDEPGWDGDCAPGYRAGWLRPDLREFFKLTKVDFPDSTLAQSPTPMKASLVATPALAAASDTWGMEEERPVGTRERTTLLTVIAALAEEAKISLVTPSKSAELIADMTERMGAPVAKRTIEEHLKKVPDALERKSR